MGEYVRLYEKFKQLLPHDGPEEITTLIGLVENGTLKEEGDCFVIRGTGESVEDGKHPGMFTFFGGNNRFGQLGTVSSEWRYYSGFSAAG
jgi:hypothetical protein